MTGDLWRIAAVKHHQRGFRSGVLAPKVVAEATARRVTNDPVLEDAERLICDWNWRQARRRPACRTTQVVDLRALDRHRGTAVTSLIPALSCRSGLPNLLFAELVRLSPISIAAKIREKRRRRTRSE